MKHVICLDGYAERRKDTNTNKVLKKTLFRRDKVSSYWLLVHVVVAAICTSTGSRHGNKILTEEF